MKMDLGKIDLLVHFPRSMAKKIALKPRISLIAPYNKYVGSINYVMVISDGH